MSWLSRLTRPIRVFRAALEWMRVRECVRARKYADALRHLDAMDELAGRVVSQSAVMRAVLVSRDSDRVQTDLKPAILGASQAVIADKRLKSVDREYLEGCLWVLAKPIEDRLSEAELQTLKRDLRAARLKEVTTYIRDNFKLLEQPHWG